MAGVGLRQRGVIPRRPLQPDPTHPLAAGLVFCQFSGNEQGRAGGSGMSWGQSPYGRASTTSDSTSAYAVVLRRKWEAMSDWTLHCLVRITSIDTGWGSPFEIPYAPQSGSWSPPYHAFLLSQNSGSPYPGTGVNNGAGTYVSLNLGSGSYMLKDGAWHSYTVAWGGRGAVWWRDGVQFATDATTAGVTNPTVSGTPELVFGGRSASITGEGYAGAGVCSAMWGRRLSDVEVSMAHADLFEMFRDGR